MTSLIEPTDLPYPEEPMAKYEVSRSTPYDLILDQYDPEITKSPEKKLLAAVLEMAIRQALKNHRDCHNREAYAWIVLSELDDDDPLEFSYPWICGHLEIDPWQVRSYVIELKRKNKALEQIRRR